MTSFRDMTESDVIARNLRVRQARSAPQAPPQERKGLNTLPSLPSDAGKGQKRRSNRPSTPQPDPLKLELPVPPTTNLAYRNIKGGRALTETAKAFKERVRLETLLEAAKQGWTYPTGARLSLSFEVYFPNRQRRDLGNLTKLAEDSIAEALGFDDRVVDILHVERKGYDALHPRCEVELAVLGETNET